RASGTREGAAQFHDVIINMSTLTASGAMGTARLEPISNPDVPVDKAIGCVLDATPLSILVRCTAFNPNFSLGCVSSSPNLIQAVGAINSDSKITFHAAPDRTCLNIVVDTNSMYQQKIN
ncbi:MAG TPA: hypothetical protein VHU40_15775, partial [Polyangia bacterium]|nr:hypothetical protein [Polyangia bacterium]